MSSSDARVIDLSIKAELNQKAAAFLTKAFDYTLSRDAYEKLLKAVTEYLDEVQSRSSK